MQVAVPWEINTFKIYQLGRNIPTISYFFKYEQIATRLSFKNSDL